MDTVVAARPVAQFQSSGPEFRCSQRHKSTFCRWKLQKSRTVNGFLMTNQKPFLRIKFNSSEEHIFDSLETSKAVILTSNLPVF